MKSIHIFLKRAGWLGLFLCALPAETKKAGIDLEKVLQQPAAQAVFTDGKTPELTAPAPAARPSPLSPELPIWLFSRRGEHKTRLTPHEVKLLQLFFFLHDEKGISLTATLPARSEKKKKKEPSQKPSAPVPNQKASAPREREVGTVRWIAERIEQHLIGRLFFLACFGGSPYLPLPPFGSALYGFPGTDGVLYLTSPHLAHAVWTASQCCGNLKEPGMPWGYAVSGLLRILCVFPRLKQVEWVLPLVGFILQLIPTWHLWREGRDFLLFCKAADEELDKLDRLFYLLAGQGAGNMLAEWFYYDLIAHRLPGWMEQSPVKASRSSGELDLLQKSEKTPPQACQSGKRNTFAGGLISTLGERARHVGAKLGELLCIVKGDKMWIWVAAKLRELLCVVKGDKVWIWLGNGEGPSPTKIVSMILLSFFNQSNALQLILIAMDQIWEVEDGYLHSTPSDRTGFIQVWWQEQIKQAGKTYKALSQQDKENLIKEWGGMTLPQEDKEPWTQEQWVDQIWKANTNYNELRTEGQEAFIRKRWIEQKLPTAKTYLPLYDDDLCGEKIKVDAILKHGGYPMLIGPKAEIASFTNRFVDTSEFFWILCDSAVRSAGVALLAAGTFQVARALFVTATSMVALAALKSSTALCRRLGASGASKKEALPPDSGEGGSLVPASSLHEERKKSDTREAGEESKNQPADALPLEAKR